MKYWIEVDFISNTTDERQKGDLNSFKSNKYSADDFFDAYEKGLKKFYNWMRRNKLTKGRNVYFIAEHRAMNSKDKYGRVAYPCKTGGSNLDEYICVSIKKEEN